MTDTALTDVPGRRVAPLRTGFLGHPRALSALAFTETWERFSYYGMRAILVYYLYYPPAKGGYGVPKASAAAQVSAYAAMVYMLGVLGGWIADRLAGTRRTVLYGGVVIMCGHIVLALAAGLSVTYAGLMLVVLGTGLLKTNVSTLVGELYEPSDERRDAGFSLFYVGLSLGGFAGPLVVGWIQDNADFHLAFASTALGMAIGLLVYVLSGRAFGSAGQRPPNPLGAGERGRVWTRVGGVVAGIAVFVGVLAATDWLTVDRVVDLVTWVSCVLPVLYFLMIVRSPRTAPQERRRMFGYIPIFFAAVIFALLSNQQFSVLAVYAADRVDLDILGWSFPPSWFGSVDVLAIVLLAPVAAAVWARLGPRQPSPYRKMSGALLLVGVSFLVVMLASGVSGPHGKVNALWIIGVYLIMALGEVLLSPIGLSASTKLAPAAFMSQTMSLWFLSGAVGNGIGAQVVKFYDPAHEVRYFGLLGALAVLGAVALYVAAPRLRPLVHVLD
ncbi:peptide MFS transporter [Kitasatospora phosalacinea]|uniref:peptide MFS transporter n=1 Tax=Kitasatospora phosalacinea TaxID=2065 RepID=UPI000526DEF2|nr:oligopeptide:H+ symporter [Kitasatospora phosalacinea]